MAGETIVTIVGNLTADAELRFTPAGAAVSNFTVACTPRTFDRNSNEWKDGDTTFYACNAWREMAENCAESLKKGMRVVVQGQLSTRNYEHNGEKRTAVEVKVDEVGPSLRYGTAVFTRAQQGSGGNAQNNQQAAPQGNQQGYQQNAQQGYNQQGGQQGWQGQPQGQPQGNDPWAAPQGQPQGQQPPW